MIGVPDSATTAPSWAVARFVIRSTALVRSALAFFTRWHSSITTAAGLSSSSGRMALVPATGASMRAVSYDVT